jgi:serine/threonine-protein kinase
VYNKSLMDDWLGKHLNEYRLEAPLGQGGMGVVYQAEHVPLQRKVALKILPPNLANDADFRDRFLREARLAASLEHPNVLPVYDAGEADGQLFLAMRLVRGTDLAEALDSGPLETQRAIRIIEQVAGALDEAHAHGLVHRDVKPGNVLLEPTPGQERVFLGDFGLTRRMQVDTDAPASRPITRTGFFVGTPHYAAPEQIEGQPLDGRADQYSLACVLFQCLTGQLPFQRDSDTAMLVAHVTQPPPSLSEFRPDLPPALDGVLHRAMAKSPDQRYPTCTAFLQDARAALEGGPVSALPPTVLSTRPPVMPKRPRPWIPLGIGAGAAAAVVVALLLLLGHRSGPQPPGPSPSRSGSPSAGLTRTDAQVFEPFAPNGKVNSALTVARTVDGKCFAGSIADARADAWRCLAGNTLLDPCFQNPLGSTDEVGCISDPTKPELTLLKLKSPLPVESGNTGKGIPGNWVIQLEDGHICTMITGTSGSVFNKRINYQCNGNLVVVGNLDRSQAVWVATVWRQGAATLNAEPIAAAYG